MGNPRVEILQRLCDLIFVILLLQRVRKTGLVLPTRGPNPRIHTTCFHCSYFFYNADMENFSKILRRNGSKGEVLKNKQVFLSLYIESEMKLNTKNTQIIIMTSY